MLVNMGIHGIHSLRMKLDIPLLSYTYIYLYTHNGPSTRLVMASRPNLKIDVPHKLYIFIYYYFKQKRLSAVAIVTQPFGGLINNVGSNLDYNPVDVTRKLLLIALGKQNAKL